MAIEETKEKEKPVAETERHQLNLDIIDLLNFSSKRDQHEQSRPDGSKLERGNEEGREFFRIVGKDGKEKLRLEMEHSAATGGLPEINTQRIFVPGHKEPIVITKTGSPEGVGHASIKFPDQTEQTLKVNPDGSKQLTGTYRIGERTVKVTADLPKGGDTPRFQIDGRAVTDPRVLRDLKKGFDDSFALIAPPTGADAKGTSPLAASESAKSPTPPPVAAERPLGYEPPAPYLGIIASHLLYSPNQTSFLTPRYVDQILQNITRQGSDSAFDKERVTAAMPPETRRHFIDGLRNILSNPNSSSEERAQALKWMSSTAQHLNRDDLQAVLNSQAESAPIAVKNQANLVLLDVFSKNNDPELQARALSNIKEVPYGATQPDAARLSAALRNEGTRDAALRVLLAMSSNGDRGARVIDSMPPETRRQFLDTMRHIVSSADSTNDHKIAAMNWMGRAAQHLNQDDLRVLSEKSGKLVEPFELRAAANAALVEVFNRHANPDFQRQALLNLGAYPQSASTMDRAKLAAALNDDGTREAAVNALLHGKIYAQDAAATLREGMARNPQIPELIVRSLAERSNGSSSVLDALWRTNQGQVFNGMLDAVLHNTNNHKMREILQQYMGGTATITAIDRPELMRVIDQRIAQGGDNKRLAFELLTEIAIAHPGNQYPQDIQSSARNRIIEESRNPQSRQTVLEALSNVFGADRIRSAHPLESIQQLIVQVAARPGEQAAPGEGMLQSLQRFTAAGNNDALFMLSHIAHDSQLSQQASEALGTLYTRAAGNQAERDRIMDAAISAYGSHVDNARNSYLLDQIGMMLRPEAGSSREQRQAAAIEEIHRRARTAQEQLEKEPDPEKRRVLEVRRDSALNVLSMTASRDSTDFAANSRIPLLAAQQLSSFGVGRGLSQNAADIDARNTALLNVMMNAYRQHGDHGHLLAALGGVAYMTPNAPAEVRQMLEQAAVEQQVPQDQKGEQDRRRQSALAGLIALEGGFHSQSRDNFPDATIPSLANASIETLEAYRRAIPTLLALGTPEGARNVKPEDMAKVFEAQARVNADPNIPSATKIALAERMDRGAIAGLSAEDPSSRRMAFEQFRALSWQRSNDTAAREAIRKYALEQIAANPNDTALITEASRMVDLGRVGNGTDGLPHLPLASLARQLGGLPDTVSEPALQAAIEAAKARVGEAGVRDALINLAAWQVLSDSERRALCQRLSVPMPGGNPASAMDLLNSLGQENSPYRFLTQNNIAQTIGAQRDQIQGEIDRLKQQIQAQQSDPEFQRLIAMTQAGSGTSKWWLLAAGVGYPLREWGILGLTGGNYGQFSAEQRQQQQRETEAQRQLLENMERLKVLEQQRDHLSLATGVQNWSTQIDAGHRQEANRQMTQLISQYGVSQLLALAPALRQDYLSANGYQSEMLRNGTLNSGFVPPYRYGEFGSANEALSGLSALQRIMGGSGNFNDMTRPENQLRVGHVKDAMLALTNDPEMRRMLALSGRLPQELSRISALFNSGLTGTRGEHFTSFVMEQAVNLRTTIDEASRVEQRAREMTAQIKRTLEGLPANSPEAQALRPILEQLEGFGKAMDQLHSSNTWRMLNTIPEPIPMLDASGALRRDAQGQVMYERDEQGRLKYQGNSDFDPQTFCQWMRTDGVRLAGTVAGLVAGFLLMPEGAPFWLVGLYEGIGATIGTHAGHEIVRLTGSSQYGSPVIDSLFRGQTVRLDSTAPGGFREVTPGRAVTNLMTEAAINVILAGATTGITNVIRGGLGSQAFRGLYRGAAERIGNYAPNIQNIMTMTARLLKQTEHVVNPTALRDVPEDVIQKALWRAIHDAEARLYTEPLRPTPVTQELVDRTVAQGFAENLAALLRGVRLAVH